MPAIRTLFQETHLSVTDLICPIFVEEGISKPRPIESMPDIQRMPLSSLVRTAEEIRRTGIKAVILFGIPSSKDKKRSVSI